MMNRNVFRIACSLMKTGVRIGVFIVLLSPCSPADESSSTAVPSIYTDVATLPSVGEGSLFGFIPREGRYVMKVKRGWSGGLLIQGKHGEYQWTVTQTTEVGARPVKSEDGTPARDFFPSENPVLIALELDESAKFLSVRTGVATLRYVGCREGADAKPVQCELRVQVEADTEELDSTILLAVPQAKIKVTEIRSAALLTGTVPESADIPLIREIAEQFYPQILMQVRAAPDKRTVESDTTSGHGQLPESYSNHSKAAPRLQGAAPLPAASRAAIPLLPAGGLTSPTTEVPGAPGPVPIVPRHETDELRALRNDVRALRDEIRELKSLLRRRNEQNPQGAIPPKDDSALSLSNLPDGALFFSASWCVPCQRMQPIIRKLQRDGFPIRTVDVDQDPALTKALGVDQLPTFVLVKNGKVEDRIKGSIDEAVLKGKLRKPKYKLTEDTGGKSLVMSYAIADLIMPLPDAEGHTRKVDSADWLRVIELITSEINLDGWDEVAGACSIKAFEQNLSLIVRAPEDIHQKIAELLARERNKQKFNVAFEMKVVEATDDDRFRSQGIEFVHDIAYLKQGQAEAVLDAIAAGGGELTSVPKVTTFSGHLICVPKSNGIPMIPEVYLRGSSCANQSGIRISAAIQSQSMVQDLINGTIRIEDGGSILLDATEQAVRDRLGLKPGHRIYLLVQARLQMSEE